MTGVSREAPRIEGWSDWASWQRDRRAGDERFNEEHRVRLESLARAASVGLAARCTACGASSVFRVLLQPDARDDARGTAMHEPETHREGLLCPSCRLSGRLRAAFAVLDAASLARRAEVMIAEHGSAAWRQLRRRHPTAIGTEFHPERRPLLRRAWKRLWHGAVPHADLRALPFPPARFDAMLAFEVFEHIEAIDSALAECARSLCPGGVLIATAPFDEDAREDVRQATTDGGGTLRWRGAEAWHSDPLGGRVPCFHRFGWELLDRLRSAGFREAQWCRVDAPAAALFGLWVLRAKR